VSAVRWPGPAVWFVAGELPEDEIAQCVARCRTEAMVAVPVAAAVGSEIRDRPVLGARQAPARSLVVVLMLGFKRH
jgi:hypothetical protein